jgi:hypothetical protein
MANQEGSGEILRRTREDARHMAAHAVSRFSVTFPGA